MSLSIEEFRKLSRAERERRYIELSLHNKFIARVEDCGAPDVPAVSTEDFLENQPNGLDCLTKEMFREMFPEETGGST